MKTRSLVNLTLAVITMCATFAVDLRADEAKPAPVATEAVEPANEKYQVLGDLTGKVFQVKDKDIGQMDVYQFIMGGAVNPIGILLSVAVTDEERAKSEGQDIGGEVFQIGGSCTRVDKVSIAGNDIIIVATVTKADEKIEHQKVTYKVTFKDAAGKRLKTLLIKKE